MAYDIYGGVDIGGTLGATGFFRLGEHNGRKVFVTPLGNPYIYRGPYNTDYVTSSNNPTVIGPILSTKYNNDRGNFGQAVTQRIRGVGFNSVGTYSIRDSWPINLDTGAFSARPATMPFVRSRKPEFYMLNHSYGFCDIVRGCKTGQTGGGRLGDFFHPGWLNGSMARAMIHDAVEKKTDVRTEAAYTALQQFPWMIAHTMGDRDDLTGYRTVAEHWHLSRGCLVTAPSQVMTEGTTMPCYAKVALKDFLVARYGTVDNLNAAWGIPTASRYTTFDSAGGWGVGTGLLDEDGLRGHDAWLGNFRMVGANATCRKDLDDFMKPFVEAHCLGWRLAMAHTAGLPNHLLWGPLPINANHEVDAFLEGFAGPNGPDILEYQGGGFSADTYKRAYDLNGKPFVVWMTYMSPTDSEYSGSWGGVLGVADQEARATGLATELTKLMGVTGADGKKPFLGMNWWAWHGWKPEPYNFGFVDSKDNLYDGVQSTTSATPVLDEIGRTRIPAVGNWGDFITGARTAMLALDATLEGGGDTNPPTEEFMAILNAAITNSLVEQTINYTGVRVRFQRSVDNGVTWTDVASNVRALDTAADSYSVPVGQSGQYRAGAALTDGTVVGTEIFSNTVQVASFQISTPQTITITIG